MGGFVKGHDTLVLTGYRGYDTRTYRRHQTEANFLHWTWPQWLCLKPTAEEAINGIVFPTIDLHPEGVHFLTRFELIVPVTLTITVDFGVPRRRDDND